MHEVQEHVQQAAPWIGQALSARVKARKTLAGEAASHQPARSAWSGGAQCQDALVAHTSDVAPFVDVRPRIACYSARRRVDLQRHVVGHGQAKTIPCLTESCDAIEGAHQDEFLLSDMEGGTPTSDRGVGAKRHQSSRSTGTSAAGAGVRHGHDIVYRGWEVPQAQRCKGRCTQELLDDIARHGSPAGVLR